MTMRRIMLLATALVAACFCRAAETVPSVSLRDIFMHPPAESGINVWWHWQGANVTKYGITRDLESMKKASAASTISVSATSSMRIRMRCRTRTSSPMSRLRLKERCA